MLPLPATRDYATIVQSIQHFRINPPTLREIERAEECQPRLSDSREFLQGLQTPIYAPFTRSVVVAELASMLDGGLSGGTGQKLTRATVIVAAICSLVASLLSVVSVKFFTFLVLLAPC